MVKTTKGGKTMNPTDAYRKELRKKELKRNKKERKKVREVGILKKDPETLKQQIQKLEAMKAEGPLDKARKHKKRQLEDTLNLVLKKRKEYEEKMKEKGEAPVMFSHLGPVRRQATAEEEERAKHPRPEDSVYYHPTLNPSGAPPPGKPPLFKSSIGPRTPLSEASTSNAAWESKTETDDGSLIGHPLPPLPPPLPGAVLDPENGSVLHVSLPLPPPPPLPPKPTAMDTAVGSLPPPPPPGPPPKELLAQHPPLPPPPPIPQSTQPTLTGTDGSEKPEKSEGSTSRDSVQMPILNIPPPPPPVSVPPNSGNKQPDGSSSNSETRSLDANDVMKMAPPPAAAPPPPPRQQTPVPGAAVVPNLRADVLPPGISHFPPPPPPIEMHPPLPPPGVSGQPVPRGVMVPLLPRPLFGPPPGHPPMMRPPLPPGPPPVPHDDLNARPTVPQKPTYVKSAASTVVKRPLAQHTPELTAMVPASVRVKRESTLSKLKSKAPTVLPTKQPVAPSPKVAKQQPTNSSSASKPQSIEDSYTAFLEDMKALGALDG